MRINLDKEGKMNKENHLKRTKRLTNKDTSEPPAGTPAAEGRGRNNISLPPKPKDTPTGRLYHFGALRGAA